jgi:steroid delta-isomerase-like uncharacterized protein
MDRCRPRIVLGALAITGMLAGAGAPLAVAQEATPRPGEACPAPTVGELEAVVAGWFDALNGGDPEALRPLLAADVRDDSPNFPPTGGADALVASVAATLEAFPDVRYEPDVVLADAPYAVAHWTATGTNTGPFMGNPPTGAAATWEGIRVFRVECGAIAEAWGEVDQVGRLIGLGLAEGTPAPAPAVDAPAPAATSGACPPSGRALVETDVRQWWDLGWNRGNPAALEPVVADGLRHDWATGPDTVGFPALAERIAAWRTAMPDLNVAYGDVIVDGDWAAATWTATGTDTGGLMGATPTGVRATWTGINLFRIDCGEIAEVWSEMDVLSLRSQLDGPGAAATPGP